VSRTDASNVRGNREYIELKTQKAGILFTTPTIQRYSSDHDDYVHEYKKLQSDIAKEVISIVGSYFPILESLNQVVAQLDVFMTLACAAVFAPTPYIRPQITCNGEIELIGARHPCVEVQDDVSFIENDVHLNGIKF
jgi:DNA mismatch repair protein MSH2